MYNVDSPYHILNRCNIPHKQTPLYVAAKHGHLDMVKFLITLGADPKIQSIINENEHETILEVSVRWSHVKIVRYLLKSVGKWKKDDIEKAFIHVMEDNDNLEIRYLLVDYSKANFGKFYTCLNITYLCSCFCLTQNKVSPLP